MPKVISTYFIDVRLNLHIIERSILQNDYNLTKVSYNHSVFQLEKISRSEIFAKRKSHIPGFILKLNEDTFFYTEIPKKSRFRIPEYEDLHLCKTCKNFRNCRKVLDGSIVETRARTNSEEDAITKASRIEKYNFIRVGFESFNTAQRSFKIMTCENYIYSNPKSVPNRISSRRKNEIMLNLSQYLNPDIDNMSDFARLVKLPEG